MMPPRQETSITVTPTVPAITNRPENHSVHAVPTSSASNCVLSQAQQQHQPTPAARFSVLHQSLRPVTLKFEDVGYTIPIQSQKNGCLSQEPKPTRTVLNGVTGIARPSIQKM